MFEGTSKDFKALVLLRVIKRAIENTESYGLHKLENILGSHVALPSLEEIQQDRERAVLARREKIKESVKSKFTMTPSVKIEESQVFVTPLDAQSPQAKPSRPRAAAQQIARRPPPRPRASRPHPLATPPQKRIEQRDTLPAHLSYLKPTSTEKKVAMDLGKLTPFLEDPHVDSIETEGENEKVYVMGKMGKKSTSVVLTKEEIDGIIDLFSKESKIPKVEGLFKVSIHNLILTAMISNVISSRFIIKKIRE